MGFPARGRSGGYAETETIRKTLEAMPVGSTMTFAIEDLEILLSAGAPLIGNTDAYQNVEDLARACDCSFSLEENACTITFHRK
jgi:hypothetical protein